MAHETFQNCMEACLACARSSENCGDTCIVLPNMANCVSTNREVPTECWRSRCQNSSSVAGSEW